MLKFMLQHLNLCLELLLDVIRHASEGSTFQNLKIIPPRRTWPCTARSRAQRPLFLHSHAFPTLFHAPFSSPQGTFPSPTPVPPTLSRPFSARRALFLSPGRKSWELRRLILKPGGHFSFRLYVRKHDTPFSVSYPEPQMAKLIYALNQSLDGYVDHMKIGGPDPALSRHFIEQARRAKAAIYGRRMYEIMRYWDNDLPDWDAGDHDFASVWRSQHKWVVSRSLQSVGPNATLINHDFETVIRKLKAESDGEIEVAGPNLAASLTNLGLIDQYRLY